ISYLHSFPTRRSSDLKTAMQTTFGINMLALVNGRPHVLNIKECLQHYLDHQVDIIKRRTAFELRKAEARAHILEGLRVALDHLRSEEHTSELQSRFDL